MLKIQMLIQKLVQPVQNDEGATIVEYGLIVALVSVAAIAGLTLLGGNLQAMYDGVAQLIVAP
jgi:pilus assembly protein Flp/PilA